MRNSMYPRKPQVINWGTPADLLFDKLKTVKVIDDIGIAAFILQTLLEKLDSLTSEEAGE